MTRRIKSGHERAYEEFLAGITGAANAFPGYLGAEIFRPTGGSGEYRHHRATGWPFSPG